MTIYTRTDLNQILRVYGEEFNFDQTTPRVLRTLSTHKLLENGLWLVGYDPSISAGETPAERTLFEWHPRQNIDLPALPIPFTENELAAFFLDGGGWFLHQHFRDSSANGLSDEALEGLRENSANARDALQQAHALYLLAASRFDLNDDAGIRGAAEWLLQLADDVMPVVAPANDEPKVKSDAPMPVNGLPTKQIAECFADCTFTETNWPKRLSATKWLSNYKIAPGEAGGASAVWNVLGIAQEMHGRIRAGKEKNDMLRRLSGRFVRMPALAPWKDQFNEYAAMFSEVD